MGHCPLIELSAILKKYILPSTSDHSLKPFFFFSIFHITPEQGKILFDKKIIIGYKNMVISNFESVSPIMGSKGNILTFHIRYFLNSSEDFYFSVYSQCVIAYDFFRNIMFKYCT